MNAQSMSGPLIVCFAAVGLFFATSCESAFAQTPAPEPRPAIIVSGTVRDSAGTPIVDVSVVFEEKGSSASIEAKTDQGGTFSFLAMRGGVYVVRARREGFRETVAGPMELSLGQRKQLDLVLTAPKQSVHAKKQSKVNSP
jgi:hypothetical protein